MKHLCKNRQRRPRSREYVVTENNQYYLGEEGDQPTVLPLLRSMCPFESVSFDKYKHVNTCQAMNFIFRSPWRVGLRTEPNVSDC